MDIDTPTKELLFSTVRIINEGPKGTSVGTGFLMSKSFGEAGSAVFVVTNKHVLNDAELLTIGFISRNPSSNTSQLGRREDVAFGNPAGAWTGHPDPEVDVAVLPVTGIITEFGDRLFYRSIPATQMPSDLFDRIHGSSGKLDHRTRRTAR